MFPIFWPRTLRAFALLGATLLAQSANAQAQAPCTLTADPAIVSAGASSTLTASCSPAATSYEWSGGSCIGTTTKSTCMVSPTVTTAYSVTGINSTGGTIGEAKVGVFTAWPYDGIYQWAPGYFLSVHRIGRTNVTGAGDGVLIGTIYWAYNSNTFTVGSRPVAAVNTFDLFDGIIDDSKSSVTVKGERFFRSCALSYDLKFNSESITVTNTSVSNSKGVFPENANYCADKYKSEDAAPRTINRIR